MSVTEFEHDGAAAPWSVPSMTAPWTWPVWTLLASWAYALWLEHGARQLLAFFARRAHDAGPGGTNGTGAHSTGAHGNGARGTGTHGAGAGGTGAHGNGAHGAGGHGVGAGGTGVELGSRSTQTPGEWGGALAV